MRRNIRTEGIVLRNNRFGEIHKGVVFLSPEYGVMDAAAYGAYSPKGKLRSVTNPLCMGTFGLYRDPVKDSYKVTDMDCREFFEGIRESLSKFYAASVLRETVLKTFGGDAEDAYELFTSSLRCLNETAESRTGLVLIQFLWRWLEKAGNGPALDECFLCGRRRESREPLYFRPGGHGLFCEGCAGGASSAALAEFRLSPGALGYLRHTLRISLEKALFIDLDSESLGGLRRTALGMIQDLAGTPFQSIRTGVGLL